MNLSAFVPDMSQSRAASTKAACVRSLSPLGITIISLANPSSEDRQARHDKLVIPTAIGEAEWCGH